jgi:hypothetical protein
MSPKEFVPNGPFPVPTIEPPGRREIDTHAIKTWWNDPPQSALRGSIGCYVFARQMGRALLPLYIGKTWGSFETEIFQLHKREHVRQGLRGKKGTLHVILLEYQRTQGPISQSAINDLERNLIRDLWARYPDSVMNVKEARERERLWVIRGVQTRGQPSKAAKTLRQLLGTKAPPPRR